MQVMRMIEKAFNAKRDHAIFESSPGLLERSITMFQLILPEAIKNRDRYWSQFGQDILVSTLLSGKKGGTFLDIGARCGIVNSNTVALERYFEWSGQLIEPHRESAMKAKSVRKSPVLACACSDETGMLEFVEFGEEPGHSRLQKDFKGRASPEDVERYSVQVTTVAEICSSNNYQHIDYLDIDVEGGELSVLKGTDLGHVSFNLIGVETHPTAFDEVSRYLERFHYLPRLRLGVDTFYAKDDVWEEITSRLPRLVIGA